MIPININFHNFSIFAMAVRRFWQVMIWTYLTCKWFIYLILVPPRWTVETRDTSVVRGRSLTIDCATQGYPYPRIIWTKSASSQSLSRSYLSFYLVTFDFLSLILLSFDFWYLDYFWVLLLRQLFYF